MTPSIANSSEAYCKCWKDKLLTPTPWENFNDCKCGENISLREWSWDRDSQPISSSLIFSDDCDQVTFHPFYSSGTALVRGDQPLLGGRHYYWEIKMLTQPYGTDIMVGLGTPKMTMLDEQRRFQFASLLGENAESYGLSYTGAVYHDAKVSSDCPGFGRGSIIGVRVDMWAGTLEFFINRKPIGAVFQELKKHQELFPMLSSTAAQSSMKLIYAASWKASLLVDAAKILAASIRNSAVCQNNDPKKRKYVKLPPGLFATLQKQFWITMPLEDDNIREYVEPQNLPALQDFTNTMMTSLLPSPYLNTYFVDTIPPEFRLVVFN